MGLFPHTWSRAEGWNEETEEKSEETHDVMAPPCLGQRAQYQEYGGRPLSPESRSWHPRRRQPPRMVVPSGGSGFDAARVGGGSAQIVRRQET